MRKVVKQPKLRPGSADAIKAPPGYKRTDVGVIPEDWEVRPLEGIADSKRPICYGIVQVGPFARNGIPVLAIKNLNTDYFTNVHRSSPEIEAPYARSRVSPGDILLSVKGTTGRVGVVPLRFEGNISRDIARLRLTDEDVPEFWFQMLQSATAKRELGLATVGTTRMELSIGILKQVRMPRPPKKEQSAIGEALSDVDGLISALDNLIAKKRAIKKAAMQQLLTGKTRLPGFEGEWETKTLGDLADIKNGATPSTQVPAYWNGAIPWCTPTDITSTPGKYLTATERSITTEGLNSCAASALPAGALLLCSRATIGEIKIAAMQVCTNQGFKSLICKDDVSNEYVYYLLLTLKPRMIERATGSTFLEIGKHDVATLPVSVPRLDEQNAIATALSDMDAEIAGLEARRDKTKAIKQGMMQKLLTGRTRLVKPRMLVAEAKSTTKAAKSHNWQINEAVVISVLVKQFGSEQYPLGRKRYTKLSYLLHRHAEKQAEGYLKKAAGPYNPRTKYGGPEKIALQNGYIREYSSGKFQGFVAAENIADAERYFENWYGPECGNWLEQFRFKKNDDLEVLATVDMVVEELRAAQKGVSVNGVKDVIRSHPEWQAKLDRPAFLDASIAQAIEICRTLFG